MRLQSLTVLALGAATTAVIVPCRAAEPVPRQVFVVNTQDASVSLVDLTTMKELQRHPVGPRPYGIAVGKDGQTVAVGVEDEECVKFYSLPDFKLKGKTPIGKMHNDHIILTQDGKHILVANFYSDDVVGIDIETMKEAFRIKECSAPHVVKYGPKKKLAYVTCKKITGIAIIDPGNRKLVKFHQININPRSLTFSPDETKVYFGPFWTNGIFEMDAESGKITRLFELPPPDDNAAPQEVTYHGVEAVLPNIVLAANEGRSYIDAVHVRTGKLLDRLTKDVSKPCCVERIPGGSEEKCQALVSNIGDGTLQLIEITIDGKMKSLGKVEVGKAPKRVAFLPLSAPQGAAPLRSGPQVGSRLPGAFHPLAVVHAEMPQRAGKKHTFVEQYEADPVVLIFARQVGEPLTSLIKKLDVEAGKRKSTKLRALVTLLAEDPAIEENLRDLAQKEGIKHISLAVVAASRLGNYRLAEDADLTAILYRKHKIEANYAWRRGEWNEESIDRVISGISRLVAD
jgi:hypothetical protein